MVPPGVHGCPTGTTAPMREGVALADWAETQDATAAKVTMYRCMMAKEN